MIPYRKSDRPLSEIFGERYFTPFSGVSSFTKPYTWENEGTKCMVRAWRIKEIFNPDSALDLGCSRGFQIKALLALGVEARGWDVSSWAIEHCEPEAQGRVKQGNIAEMNELHWWPPADVVVSMETLEHLPDYEIAWVVSEIARLAKIGAYIEVPVGLGIDNEPSGDITHQTFMPPSWWISVFHTHGLLYDPRFSTLEVDALHLNCKAAADRGSVELAQQPGVASFVFWKGRLPDAGPPPRLIINGRPDA